MQPVFGSGKSEKTYPARAVRGEVAEDLFHRGLCLPSGTALTENDLNRIIEILLKCRGQQTELTLSAFP